MTERERQVVQKLVNAAYKAKAYVRHSPVENKESTFAELVIAISEVEMVLAADEDCPPTPRNDL